MATTYTLKRKMFIAGISNLTTAFTGVSQATRNAANAAKTAAMNSSKATGSALKQVGKDAYNKVLTKAGKDVNTVDRLKAGAKGLGGLGLAAGGAVAAGGLALGASDG